MFGQKDRNGRQGRDRERLGAGLRVFEPVEAITGGWRDDDLILAADNTDGVGDGRPGAGVENWIFLK